MSDLIEALRNAAACIEGRYPDSLLRQSADEIEKLRNELTVSRELCTKYESAVGEDVGEILKLREQLVKASDLVRTLVENDPYEPIADNGAVVLDLWRQQARAFLGDEHAN